MELRQLKYFLAVADARSFVSAANTLFISRQAVSKAVAQLEAELGVELFARDTSGAFLTPAGVMFYDRVRNSVMELDQIRTEMQRYGSRYHQRIRLAFSVGTLSLYEQTLFSFHQEQENIDCEYRECPEETCLSLLREHKADLAICVNAPQSADFSVRPLVRSRFGVLLKKTDELNTLDSLELRDLSWLPLSGLSGGSCDAFCRRHRLQLRYTGFDLYRLYLLVQRGQCAMLLPECLIPREMTGLLWLPLEAVEEWQLFSVYLRSLENNVLYHTAMDELQSRVFEHGGQQTASV